MEEQVFLEEPGIRISSTRFDIQGQTFATRNVGSVAVVKPSNGTFGIICIVIGVLALFGAPVFGGILIIVGAALVYGAKIRRELRLVAGGGEVVALKSSSPALVERVRGAIAQAISVR